MAAADDVPPDQRVVVLLRAINLGGASKLAMSDLRDAASTLGHTDVATHLATGNLLLTPADGSPRTTGALAERLSADLGERLGRPLALVVRTRAQIDAIVAANPYPDAARDDPSHLVVVFFDGPAPEGEADLERYGRESGTWRGSEGYLWYPDGIGRSKVTAAVIDRLAGRSGTGRNWRTVLALQEKLRA